MDAQLTTQVQAQAMAAKQASQDMRKLPTQTKNAALLALADLLEQETKRILEVNQTDINTWTGKTSPVLLQRLVLTPEKIKALAESARSVATLPDPVGEVVKMNRRPNGLRIAKIRIPIGVLCCIFESRPSVTIDIACLAIKSGNACILRGGKEALDTNTFLAHLVVQAFSAAGVPKEAVQFIAVQDHAAIPVLAEMADQIDLIIPRGGQGLIDAVCASAKMPVLHHRKGVTHVYVDSSGNIEMATKIVVNGKVSNPSVCNSLEKVLIDESIAEQAVPQIVAALQAKGVEVRGCERTQRLVPEVTAAQEADWSTEYLDLIITMKVVAGMAGALEHLQRYSSGLADGIVTENYERAWEFVTSVDSAATYVNASTRFTDGGEFGLGAEVGISTAKIHGMGPMGLEDLTVTKYIVFGDGQIRE